MDAKGLRENRWYSLSATTTGISKPNKASEKRIYFSVHFIVISFSRDFFFATLPGVPGVCN